MVISNANVFIENIQGLLIYLVKKNGYPVTLKELLEKDEATFKFILEDYNENHNELLTDYLKERELRTKGMMTTSLIETYEHFELHRKGASDKEFEDALEETLKYDKDVAKRLPSKFQQFSSFSTVDYLLSELMDAAPLLKCNIPQRPAICTVSTRSVNACTLILDTGEPVIFVEEDILSFIHLYSKVFCQCLTVGPESNGMLTILTGREEIIKNIENNPEILLRFQDFLKSYITDGSPRDSEQYYLEKDIRYYLCTHLMMSAELFIIGHEIGHYIANHLTSRREFGFFNQELNVAFEEKNWDKEYEADYIGMCLAMQAMARQKFGPDFCYLGIEPFFIVYDIARRARKILKDGDEEISNEFNSHPPNVLRRQKTRSILEEMTPPEDYKRAIYAPDIINEAMEYLWEKSKHIFYQAYRDKSKTK